jgi:hypothetical protein
MKRKANGAFGKPPNAQTLDRWRLPATKPEGEDFFVVAVRIHNPKDPCWDDGFSLMGSWEIINRDLDTTIALTPKMIGYRKCRLQLKLYQGEEARDYMNGVVKDELRYAEQKHAQRNN